MSKKHWSKIQLLHKNVKNSNIIIKGTHSYYSDCWDAGFEESVVRYLYGDEISKQWETKWPIDKLYVGDYVCIAPEVVIMMGGNHTHRSDWFCLYPFMEFIEEAYVGKGDTHICDGVWLGMRSIVMPGVTIGEGAIIATNTVVTKDVEPYSIVAGSPARLLKYRFSKEVIEDLLKLNIYNWDPEKFECLKRYICSSDIIKLEQASIDYDSQLS